MVDCCEGFVCGSSGVEGPWVHRPLAGVCAEVHGISDL